jgi:uncharacterized protein (DUF2147 family)
MRIAQARRHARRALSLLALVTLVSTPTIASAQTSPVGVWRTISDVDGSPTALVEIHERDGELVGVVKAVLSPGDSDAVCNDCPGDRRGQRIVGLEILRHMRPDGDGWSGGEILDPDNGKVYRAKMHLEAEGTRLVVRGFIGFALFGRSQTWLRAQDRQ